MGFQVVNGRGNGAYSMEVDKNGRSSTKSMIVFEDSITNEDGQSWTWTFSTTTTGTDNIIFYIKNTGTKELDLTDIRVFSDNAASFDFAEVTGTPSGGSDITAASKNLGKAITPATTAQDGVITGLTYGTPLYENWVKANDTFQFKTSSHIKVPNGKAIAIRWRGGTGHLVKGTVSLHVDLFNHPENSVSD